MKQRTIRVEPHADVSVVSNFPSVIIITPHRKIKETPPCQCLKNTAHAEPLTVYIIHPEIKETGE